MTSHIPPQQESQNHESMITVRWAIITNFLVLLELTRLVDKQLWFPLCKKKTLQLYMTTYVSYGVCKLYILFRPLHCRQQASTYSVVGLVAPLTGHLGDLPFGSDSPTTYSVVGRTLEVRFDRSLRGDIWFKIATKNKQRSA